MEVEAPEVIDDDRDSVVVSLRLDPKLAAAFRMEAARRGMRLNRLFAEMWDRYREGTNVASR